MCARRPVSPSHLRVAPSGCTGGGDLDTPELKRALKQMMEASKNRTKLGDAAKVAAAALRGRASRVRSEQLPTVQAAEAACAALRAARAASTIGSELGDIIAGKGLKAADVAKKWDSSGDGEIDQREFRKNVLAMGVSGQARTTGPTQAPSPPAPSVHRGPHSAYTLR